MPHIKGFPLTWQERVRNGPWLDATRSEYACPLCDSNCVTKLPVVIAATPEILSRKFKVCDECRRKLCTCDTCTAFKAVEESPELAVPDNVRWAGTCSKGSTGNIIWVETTNWCRDDYRQAKPLLIEEVEKRLGQQQEPVCSTCGDDGYIEDQHKRMKCPDCGEKDANT
jgi:predicted RNA-binding Zn-ribbon protein involved in translation (DUF1610 family)